MDSREVTYEYVEEVDPNLVCSICHSALVDPVTTSSCKHTFCRECITLAHSHNALCPIDRSALNLASLVDTEQLVKIILDELQVRCTAEGCGAVMQRGLLRSHLRTCSKSVVVCKGADCGLAVSRGELLRHRGYECFQRKMACDKCGVEVTFKDAKMHVTDACSGDSKCKHCGETGDNLHQWTCPQARVLCPQAHRGCPSSVSRANLSVHLGTCPFEALSAYFETTDAKFAALEDANRKLAQQLGEVRLYSQPRLSRYGPTNPSDVIPRGLANYLAQAPGGYTPPSNHLFPPAAAATPYGSPPLSTMLAPPPPMPELAPFTPVGGSPVLPPPSPVTDDHPALPEREAYELHQIRLRRRRAEEAAANERTVAPSTIFAPSFGSRTSASEAVFGMLNPGLGRDAAGREIAALRDSVMRLAGDLDLMERRNEVRSMTETLRLQEEVGALRAVVGTLRTQVMQARQRQRSSPSMQPAQPHPRPIPPRTPPAYAGAFAAYRSGDTFLAGTSPDTHRVVMSDDDDDGPDRHNIRESIVSMAHVNGLNPAGERSVQSLVSTASATRRRNDRAGPGRPMAIPSEQEAATDPTVRLQEAPSRPSSSRSNPMSLFGRRLNRSASQPRL